MKRLFEWLRDRQPPPAPIAPQSDCELHGHTCDGFAHLVPKIWCRQCQTYVDETARFAEYGHTTPLEMVKGLRGIAQSLGGVKA